MGWNETTQKKEKKMTYIHCDIRDGVDVKKPKSISRIIDGPQKVKKIKIIHGITRDVHNPISFL